VNVLETLGHLHQYLSKVGQSQASTPLPVVTDDISQISTYANEYTVASRTDLHIITEYFCNQ